MPPANPSMSPLEAALERLRQTIVNFGNIPSSSSAHRYPGGSGGFGGYGGSFSNIFMHLGRFVPTFVKFTVELRNVVKSLEEMGKHAKAVSHTGLFDEQKIKRLFASPFVSTARKEEIRGAIATAAEKKSILEAAGERYKKAVEQREKEELKQQRIQSSVKKAQDKVKALNLETQKRAGIAARAARRVGARRREYELYNRAYINARRRGLPLTPQFMHELRRTKKRFDIAEQASTRASRRFVRTQGLLGKAQDSLTNWIQRVRQQVSRTGGARAKERKAGQAVTAAGEEAEGAAGAAAAALRGGQMAGTAGAIVAGIAGLAALAVISIKAAVGLKKWSDNLNESNKKLIGFSGELTSAHVQLMIGDINRQIKMAQATSKSGSLLANAIDETRNKWLKFDIEFADLQNRFATRIQELTVRIAPLAEKFLDFTNKVILGATAMEHFGDAFNQMMDDIARSLKLISEEEYEKRTKKREGKLLRDLVGNVVGQAAGAIINPNPPIKEADIIGTKWHEILRNQKEFMLKPGGMPPEKQWGGIIDPATGRPRFR